MAITVAMRAQVSQLYVSLFGRAPDAEGLGFWVQQLDSGKTVAQVADTMYAVPAARDYYPSFLTNQEIVKTFYKNVLGRDADAEGLAFWTAELGKAASKGAFFEKLVNAVVNYSGTDADGLKSKALFLNKVAVAQYYGEQSGDIAGATAALNGVTEAADSVTAAKAAIDAGTGQTFMLTASMLENLGINVPKNATTADILALVRQSNDSGVAETAAREARVIAEAAAQEAAAASAAASSAAAAAAKAQADAALAAVNNTPFASEQAAFDAAKAAGDAALRDAQRDADLALFKANFDLRAAQETLAAVNNTVYASEQAAFDAAKAAGDAALAQAQNQAQLEAIKAANDLTAANAALKAAQDAAALAKTQADAALAAVNNTTYASEQAAFDAAKAAGDQALALAQQQIDALQAQINSLTVARNVTLTTSTPSVTEGDAGTKNLTFVLRLDKAYAAPVVVNYYTEDGTATAGDDYETAAGAVTFAAGQTSAIVTVVVKGDTAIEADETIRVEFSGAALVNTVTATGTITNDDVAQQEQNTFTITSAQIALANANNVPVTLDVGGEGSKTVTVQSDGASATRGIIINGNANTTINSGASADSITLSGNGNNTISTGGGNDTVTVFGSGNNTINVGTGNDTVVGGTGSDTIVFASGALGAGDVVTGGAGVTTVRISGDGNIVGAGGATLTGVESIVLDGTTLQIDAQTLINLINAGLTTIKGSSATSKLEITALNAVAGSLLDLTNVIFEGGLKSITTSGTGTIVLTTEQSALVETVVAAINNGGTLTKQVIVDGAQTVAEAAGLMALGVTASFALKDTAANLALAPVAVFNKAVSIEATTVATAAQAASIAAIDSAANSFTASASNLKYSVSDTASMLANYATGLGNATTVAATTDATVAEAAAIHAAAAGGVVVTTATYAVKDTVAALSPTVTVTTTNASTAASVASTAGFYVGMPITGANIPAGTTVTAINGNGTDFTLSANATGTGADATGAVFINGAVLNAATSVTINDAATIAKVNLINTGLNTVAGGLTKVAAGYDLTDAAATLINQANSAVTGAARNITVANNGAVSVADAVAIEGLSNSGSNTYKLSDTPALIRSASSAITAVATKPVTGGVEATGNNTTTLTVSELNALVAKFGTSFSTARKVVDTAAEIVKLTPAALAVLGNGDIEFLSTSTATVAELNALNKFKTDNSVTQGPAANAVKVADTAAALEAAVNVPATLAALEASHSVAVTGSANVAQIAAINAKLAVDNTALNAVAAGYELSDTAAKLSVTNDANVTRDIIDNSSKVTVTGTATADQIDTIVDAFYTTGGAYAAADLGDKVVYTLRDTASNILGQDVTGGAAATLDQYQTGASSISITDATVTAANAVSLRALAKFDRVYAIEDNAAGLNAANLTNNAPNENGRAAMAGATKVTLVDALATLFNGPNGTANSAQALASTVIASDSLTDLTNGNATNKANVDGFRITGGDLVFAGANVIEQTNALSALKPTEYTVATTNYDDLMGNGAGVATFVKNAKSLTVTDALTVAKFNTLDARADGKITYTLQDSASALASAAASIVSGATTTTVLLTEANANATVAEAVTLIARGVTGFVINDTAAAITAAGDTVLLSANVASIHITDGGEVTLSVDAALKTFDLNLAQQATPDGSARAKYNLVDTAAKLAAADAELIGFANNVTATTVATATPVNNATQAGNLAAFNSMGSIVYDVADTAANLISNGAAIAGANEARNVTVLDTGVATVTQAVILQAATNSGTTSYKIADTAAALALANTTQNAAAIAAIEAATGTVVVNNGANANVTAAEATLIAAYAKPVTYDLTSNAASIGATTVSAAALNEARAITVSDAVTPALATKLLAATNTGTTTIHSVSATAAEALALTLTSNDVITTLTVTGSTSVADAVTINSKDKGNNIGTIAFTKIVGSGQEVLDNLAVTALSTNVEVTGRISVAQAMLIEAEDAADGDTAYTYSITDTFANLMANSDALVNDVNAVAAITAADKITVDGALTIAQANSIVNVTASPDVALFTLIDVFQIVDADQNVVAAITGNSAALAKASSITMSNGVSIKLDTVGGNLHIVGSKAQIDALPASLATARKLIETSVADLNANSAFYTSAPSNVSYRVVDTAATLLTNNPLVNTADAITVVGNITMADAVAIRALGVSAAEIKYSLEDTTALLSAGPNAQALTDSINITATTPATVTQAEAFIAAAGATGKATYSISEPDTATTLVAGKAAVFNGAINITVTTTTGGSINATEAAVLLNATNSGSTTIALVSDTATAVAALTKGANDTITSITATGNATVAEAKILQGLSSTVTYSLSDTAANLASAGSAVLNGATAIVSTTAATLAQLSIIDAATPTDLNTIVAVADSAQAILAASTALLARANGAITLTDTSVTASTVTALADLDTANNTFSIATVTGVKVLDTSANLLLAANTAAVAAALNVEVSDAMSAAVATQVVAKVNTGAGGDNALNSAAFKYNLSDAYSSIALAPATANLATNITITNVVSASQAKTADDWTNAGTVTYAVRDNASQLANANFAAAIAKATSVTATTAATVAQAGRLSEMTNLASYTIADSATEVHNALNSVNGANAADRATVLKAASIALNTAASVAQAVGVNGAAGNGEKLGLGSIAGLTFKVSDTGAALLTALLDPLSSSVLLNASTVELNGTTGVSIAGLTKLTDIFGDAFIKHDHDANATTASRYYIKDAHTNILVADMTFVEAATTVEVDGTTNADTIDMSAFTKGMTINGAGGIDVITGGSGADTFVFASGSTGITLAAADTITDFVTTADKISTSKAAGAGTIADGTGFAASTDAGLAAFIAAADAVLAANAGNDDVYIAYNVAGTGNAYLVVDEDDNGSVNAGDTLIILTGINAANEIALADLL